MTLTVKILKNAVGPDRIATPQKIKELYKKSGGGAIPASLTPVGVVFPHLRTHFRPQWTLDKAKSLIRFNKGSLELTMTQTVIMSNQLTPCERKVWRNKHESLHISDNNDLMDKMETSIRSDTTIIPIVIKPKWIPLKDRVTTQKLVVKTVGNIFKGFVAAAIAKRDTTKEYNRVKGLVANTCRKSP